MISDVLEALKKFFSSRLFVLGAAYTAFFAILLCRIFYLQVVRGYYYQESFEMKINQTITVDASRGNIYDCNGRLLAYNDLAYSVVISDVFESSKSKNSDMNDIIAQTIRAIEANGDKIYNDFAISYDADTDSFEYNVEGSSLNRLRTDVFGKNLDKLSYNEKHGFNEASCTAEQMMEYLFTDVYKYQVDVEKYGRELSYKIVVVRYAISSNRYNRYITSTIAKDVSDKTVAYIMEHSDTLDGVTIEEDTIRRYNYSEYFASIIGYTGKISSEEYDSLSATDDSYTTNDVIGKSGLEQYYESYLRGENGEKEVYLDNVGRIVEEISEKESVAGSDLYLSIDAELQKNVYCLIEQELAGIIYESIHTGYYTLNDLYFALLNNGVIDINHFNKDDASNNEKQLYNQFVVRQEEVLGWMSSELSSGTTSVNNMSEELLDYTTDIISMLKSNGVLLTKEIDTSDDTYLKWKNGTISPREYLSYCINAQWIDITKLEVPEQYAESSEIYQSLCNYIISEIANEKSFSKIIYHYMVQGSQLNGATVCMIIYDQGVLPYDEETYNGLASGSITPYAFFNDKILHCEITPSMLALDPCTGSAVLTDANTGEIKALVSYPGYDNNRLANSVDAVYFARLNEDLSKPQYNYATQERTAPGSTFKMLTSVAGLAENVIDTSTIINCSGIFTEIDNQPRCWNHSGHGNLTVAGALTESCNVFYYTVGYNFAMDSTKTYDDPLGISIIQKYASMFGLDQTTGLEIAENKSEVASQYPVMAAIGQSNNNYTTVALSRYVTAIATGNLYDYQLMSKIVDSSGNVVDSYASSSTSIYSVITPSEWDQIHIGMKGVNENLSSFNEFPITSAGKTGTAQQSENRPTHALYVGYAPYENPEITIATRIAFGGSSHNTGDLARNILACYFNTEDINTLVDGMAEVGAGAVAADGTRND